MRLTLLRLESCGTIWWLFKGDGDRKVLESMEPTDCIEGFEGIEERGADAFLNDTWTLYFHDPDNDLWEIESYVPLATVSTVQEAADLHEALKAYWCNGMFFLMREHILPIWEDEHNANGGCFSFKVSKSEVPEFWKRLSCSALGESMFAPGAKVNGLPIAWNRICGVSISPKRSFCILRLWVEHKELGDPLLYTMEHPAYTKIMFRPFSEVA